MNTSYLPIAIRAFTERTAGDAAKRAARPRTRERWPKSVLILDTETTIDTVQRLTFGSYRYGRWTKRGTLDCVEEGVFHADDLPERDPEGFATLQEYVRTHRADVIPGYDASLHLHSRRDFIRAVFHPAAYEYGALVVGFNLPFDLSRLAVAWGEGRGRQRGGFSFVLHEYEDKATGGYREHRYRPRVAVKHLDSKRSRIAFTRPVAGDADTATRGNFVDLRTLVFALTDKSHTLASACAAFGVADGKEAAKEHGIITADYIGYNRRDVRATHALLVKVREEYDRNPIAAPAAHIYSPASIAKGYLHAMGITPPLVRQPDFPREVLGYATGAYFGGRAECRIRRTPVPVVYCDFLSMYPTVNALMDLWRLIAAGRIEVVDATEEARRFLDSVTLADCFAPGTWRELTFFAHVAPDGDVLPVRAQYDASGGYTIGLNPLTARESLWYAGPDLVQAKLLAGRTPRIVRAFRLVPVGVAPGLTPVQLRGSISVDPARDDFFRVVIEERKRLDADTRHTPEERERLDKLLKVLANSGSYGIFAEMNRHTLPVGKRETVRVHANDGAFDASTAAPEEPGAFAFPPLAALITAAARLMLALLERRVTDAGGSYAFCDTDSMAIVATERGGLVPCAGGAYRLPDGTAAVRALSWAEVDAIATRFAALNPYDRAAVPGSVLKVEDVNYAGGERRQLWTYAISAKRYALFTYDEGGGIAIVDAKEHGLGHLLNPTDPDDDNRDWITTVWEGIVTEAHGKPFQWPAWLSRPALSKLALTSPAFLRPFAATDRGKPYADAMKPMNFVLSAHVAPFGHPTNVDPARFHLIAPYTPDGRQWKKLAWTDTYGGGRHRIATTGDTGGAGIARVQTYADVLREYRVHPEPKSDAPDGTPCAKDTAGLLRRRAVCAMDVRYIGKESNRLDDVDAGAVSAWDDVRNEYRDPRRDPWKEHVAPILKEMRASDIAAKAGISERAVKALRNGHAQPKPAHRTVLTRIAADHAREHASVPLPREHLAACAAYLTL